MPVNDISAFLNIGIAGVVLLWFMRSLIPEIQKLRKAVQDLAQAQMLTLLTLSGVDPHQLREQAQQMIEQIRRENGSVI
jgi:hypothetical protein